MKTTLPSVPMLVIVQAVVSAASLVVEIVAGRMLAPYVGMSLYTWTSIIAVVLAGFSVGHWIGGRIAEMDTGRALALTAWSMLGAGVTTAAALFMLRFGADLILPLTQNQIVAIVGLCTVAFFVPSLFAGIPAPVLAQISVDTTPDQSGRALGAMFAAGAIGAIGGTLLAGFVFISWLGSIGTLVVVTVVYFLSAALIFLWAARAGAVPRRLWPVVAFVLGMVLAGASLAQPSPCTEESNYFCIRTIELSDDPSDPVRMMVLDHLVHGAGAERDPNLMFYDSGALFDMLAVARKGGTEFSAFIIGGGTFSVPRKWGQTTPPADVTVAEIDPEVTRVAARDFWFDPATARVLDEDARGALLRDPRRYDLILGDAFTDIAAPPHLITREFFELVRDRLEPGGSYLMNVIDHADNLRVIASVVATLREVFPVVEVWTEARRPEPGERLIFIVAAGTTETPVNLLDGRSPDPIRFGRLADDTLAQILALRDPVVLTDDFSPIDRLIGTRF